MKTPLPWMLAFAVLLPSCTSGSTRPNVRLGSPDARQAWRIETTGIHG
jgi:hypothetical protein